MATMDPITLSLLTAIPGLLGNIGKGGSYAGTNTGGMSPDSALNPIFGAMQLAPNIFQAGLGIKQLLDARKLEKSTVRPTYAIPGAQQEALATSRSMAYGDAPGLQVAQANMGRNIAGGMSSALQAGGPEGLAAASMLAQQGSDQSMALASMQNQWRTQQMGNVLAQLNRQAEYQDTAWRKNREEPYLNASEKSAQLRDAGYTNVNDSLYGAGGAVASFAKNGMFAGKGRYAGPTVGAPEMPPPTEMQSMTTKGPISLMPTGVDRRSMRTEVPPVGYNYNSRSAGSLTPDYNSVLQKSMRTGINIDAPVPAPQGPYPSGYDPETQTMRPVVGPPNYNPAPIAPDGPYPAGYNGKPEVKPLSKDRDALGRIKRGRY